MTKTETELRAEGKTRATRTRRIAAVSVPESGTSEKPARNKRPYTSGSAAIYRELNAKVEGAKAACNTANLELVDLKEKLDRDIQALTDIYNAEVEGRLEYIRDQEKVIAMGEAAFAAHESLENANKSNVAMAS